MKRNYPVRPVSERQKVRLRELMNQGDFNCLDRNRLEVWFESVDASSLAAARMMGDATDRLNDWRAEFGSGLLSFS